MATLLLGAVLAVGAMAWVLYPLFAESAAPRDSRPTRAAALPEPDAAAAHAAEDAAEALIRAYRQRPPECPVCGPRPEPDAIFCSTCGRRLAVFSGPSVGRADSSSE